MWRFGHGHHRKLRHHQRSAGLYVTLLDVLPGERALLMGFSPGLPREHLAHLQAYGLVPGRTVRVLQHAPVTVVEVEHCEIALEAEMACQIHVGQVSD